MPKIAVDAIRKSATTDGRTPHPSVLKRNQACHQCRRRKLKCDAQRPSCSTCVRSHNHFIAHAPPGSSLAQKPICTYDEAESSTPANGPKNKYERLENRISELEALLKQKQEAEISLTYDRRTKQDLMCEVVASSQSCSGLPRSVVNTENEASAPLFSPVHPANRMENIYSHQYTTSISGSVFAATPSTAYDLVWSSWSPALPQQPLLVHLVDVFFKFHPHAHRLFHRPNFLTSLSFPPSHPKFPSSAVLHAICAVGSLYTAAVTSPPRPTFEEFPPDELFCERQRLREQRPDSFAEQQAKFAKETIERLNVLGKDLFQALQASIVLTWFYWPHGRWVDVFFSSAFSTRLCVPLGLNMCPPFHSITKSERPPSILPPAQTVMEDEIRRNAFWLAYATERLHGYGNPWALNLDDQDISQLLPVRGEEFDRGHLVLPQDRQWAHTRNVLSEHPERFTDSFTLYIKGSILISRVKTFNLRFRARHLAGDTAVSNEYQEIPERADPRGSQAFIELDYTIDAFTSTFPSRCKNPITNNIVDSHLYTAWLVPHVASIILHDPHADVQRSGCMSALKVLTAARAILDLVYSICSTSFETTLLEPFCLSSWFCAGRVLTRFLQVAQDTSMHDQHATLQAELDFLRTALNKQGERIPLAFRFARMLDDLLGDASNVLFACQTSCHYSSFYLYFAMEDRPQATINVAVLGPLGTYTHEAAHAVFGSRVHYREQRTITDVFESLSPTIVAAVVPRENSIYGAVIETYDNLRHSSCGFIKGEAVLKVQHCLVVRKGVALEDVQRVFSHEQALGQCRTFLETYLPNAKYVRMPSTASAARALLDEPADCAAICSKLCARLFDGLEVLREGIQIEEANFTRFLILTRNKDDTIPAQFQIDHSFKALLRIYINAFIGDGEKMGITRVDRRPNLKAIPFSNVYFVEVTRFDPTSPELGDDWVESVDETLLLIRKAGYDANVVGIW